MREMQAIEALKSEKAEKEVSLNDILTVRALIDGIPSCSESCNNSQIRLAPRATKNYVYVISAAHISRCWIRIDGWQIISVVK